MLILSQKYSLCNSFIQILQGFGARFPNQAFFLLIRFAFGLVNLSFQKEPGSHLQEMDLTTLRLMFQFRFQVKQLLLLIGLLLFLIFFFAILTLLKVYNHLPLAFLLFPEF